MGLLLKWFFGRRLARMQAELDSLHDEVDRLRSRIDLGEGFRERFQSERQCPEYQAVYDLERPLVSVCIPTYNRADLITTRCLPSLMAQTYEHLEILVVGDGCTDHTEAAIAALGDPRIRFVNRPARGVYPEEPYLRWLVAGTDAMNQALRMAQGQFITHLDDDDAHAPHRIQGLLDLIRAERADLVWHPFDYELPEGGWKRMDSAAFRRNQVTTSAVFYHAWLGRIPWDPEAYKVPEAGDWNRFRKFLYLGAKLARHPEPLLRHYRERNNTP